MKFEQAEERRAPNICYGILNCFKIIDLFKFLPVPKGDEVSTARSLFGTIVIFVIMSFYVVYTFMTFLSNNTPTINSVSYPLPDDLLVEVPKFAVVFATGDDLNISFYDSRYFTFSLQQVTIFKDVNRFRIYTDMNLVYCDPSYYENWLGKVNYTHLLCPSQKLYMQGQIYSSEVHKYPRIQVKTCSNGTNVICAPQSEIDSFLGKGRLFFFLFKPGDKNYATGQISQDTFTLFFYFLVPAFYNRIEIFMQRSTIVEKPDYFWRYKENLYNKLANVGEKFYSSKTPNPYLLLLVWLRLDQNSPQSEYVFTTVFQKISDWGALWGVLFAFFAFYFLKHNQRNFFKSNPDWNKLNKEIFSTKDGAHHNAAVARKSFAVKLPSNTGMDHYKSSDSEDKKNEFIKLELADGHQESTPLTKVTKPEEISVQIENGSAKQIDEHPQKVDAETIDIPVVAQSKLSKDNLEIDKKKNEPAGLSLEKNCNIF